jgi:predicted N-formylglutamate amidohydrolase
MMDSLPGWQPLALLEADEPAAWEVVNRYGGGMAVIVCDHAANRVPRCLGSLGLDATQLSEHIAWDPGAAEVAHRLSALLDAPLVLSGYSRLVIDCNRPLGHHQSIAEQSAGVCIPGNRGIRSAERERRGEALFRPYHDAIAALLTARRQRPTLLLSIHSFTPNLNGQKRPWQVGISHWRDRRLAALLIQALTCEPDLTVGDNKPYPIEASIDYTVIRCVEDYALPAVMIEIRQDEIRTLAGASRWAGRLAAAYRLREDEIKSLVGLSQAA